MATPASSAKRFAGKALKIVLLLCLFMAMAGIGAYVSLTYIIRGEDTVMVPDLVGKDVVYVLEILSDLGLNTRVRETAYHDRVLKHHVIDQHPQAGTAIKKGRDVRIRVSRGPETVVMPNLAGLSLQHGEILLADNGLCRGAVATMFHNRYSAGQIIAQYPLSGQTVLRKTCTDLLVSKGSPLPRLSLMDLTRTDLPEKRFETSARTELLRFGLDNGFLKKRVQVKMALAQFSLNLFDEYLSPEQEVWLLVPKNGNPTISVYVDDQLRLTRFLEMGDSP